MKRSDSNPLRIAAFWIAAFLLNTSVAGPTPASADEVHVPRAIETLITPSGLRRLENDTVGSFLAELGYDPYQGVIPMWSYEASNPILLEELPVEFRRFKTTFRELADFMNSLLHGLDVRAPLPRARVDNLWYEANPSRLGIHSLRSGTDGWIEAVFEASFEWFQAEAERLSVVDGENRWLGEFGLQEASLRNDPSARGAEHFSFSIPFAFRLAPGSRDFEIRIGAIQSNFADTPIDFSFTDIALPQIEISIGDGSTSSTVALEENVLKYRRELVASLQTFLAKYAREKLAAVLNEQLKERWKDLLAFNIVTSPPGMNDDEIVAPGEGFRFDYLPARLGFDAGTRQARAAWDVRVTDLLLPAESRPARAFADRGTADFGSLGDADFDLALSLNPDLITHAIDLSLRNRGLFSDIPADEDSKSPTLYRLTSAPVFEGVIEHPTLGRVWKCRTAFGAKFGGAGSFLFKEREALLELLVYVSPRVKKAHAIEFVLAGIDVAQSRLRTESVRAGFLKSLVSAAARGKITKGAREFSRTPPVLYTYDLSPTYLGVPVRLKRSAIDASGHLLLALDQVIQPARRSLVPSSNFSGGPGVREGVSP